MATVDIGDVSLYYECVGDGPTILFVHGIFGDADAWTDQAVRLSDRYTCMRYDRRGYTRSAHDRKAGYPANADIGFTDLQSPALETTPADLAGVAFPALVLSGSESHPSFRSVAHHLAAAPPDARFVELDGSGHATYAERPDEFEHAVLAFAAELDRTTTPSA